MMNSPVRLLVDLGGTNARCALANGQGEIVNCRSYSNDLFSGLEPILTQYLDEFKKEIAGSPVHVAMAVAAPILGDRLVLTNRGWSFSCEALKKSFSFEHLLVVNDFTANVMALPKLKEQQYRQIGGGSPIADMPLGVLGPGTGLGVSGLVYNTCKKVCTPLSGEGGHVTLAAMTDEEAEVIAYLRCHFGHVSAERVLSGGGLVSLFHAVNYLDKGSSKTALLDLTPEEVANSALRGEPLALKTLRLFFDFVGTIASDLALTLGARGGIYLAGGILPKLQNEFFDSGFRKRFEDKGRYHDYLKAIPTYLITQDVPAFIGLNVLLEQLD